ncbi:hypothetical protein I3760_02G085100 [Carya illinoinensis]|nr:hypothetical protein I3760_02G085100 [Carya illinoinensis]
MFGSNMDSVQDASLVPATVLVPTRFVWRHGGNSAYLCGSFTQWSLIPMLPVEGCDNVFQTVHGLTPGYHQFKFYVDGQWRYDDSLPYYESSEYGMVNTLISATDYMDVDNEAFRRMARVTDGPQTEMVPSISDADIQGSRQRVSLFLSTHTVYELLPESGKVFVFDVDLPMKQAFHILHEQGIPMAALCDFGRGQFVGVLSALDFILILRELGSHASNLTEEELETHTISAWKEVKACLNRQNDFQGRAFPRRLIHAGPYDNLKDVTLKILQNEVATVPIIHSSSEDGSFPQLLHLASLSGILKSQVSSIPIVDDNDSLVDIYCRSDITALAKDRVYTHINLDEMTIHQSHSSHVGFSWRDGEEYDILEV